MPLRAPARAALAVLVACALAAAPSCRREGPTPPPQPDALPTPSTGLDTPEPAPPSAAPAPPRALFPASRPALADAEALAYLPADTPFVVVTGNIQALANRLGRRELEARGEGLYARLSATITRRFQRNLLDPAELAAIGLSPSSPAGFAWLDLRTSTGVVFATVDDRDRFRAALSELAQRAGVGLVATTTGDVTVLRPRDGGGVAAVLRGGKLLLVGTEGAEELASTWADRLSELPPSASLAQTPRFREAVAALDFGADAAGYLDAEAWTAYLLDALEGPEGDWGGTPTQRAAERALYEGLWGSLRSVAFGLELGRDALRFKIEAPLAPGSLLDRLLRATRGVPALLEALTLRPSLLVHLAFAPSAAAEVVRLLAELEGLTPDVLWRDLEAASLVDLQREVVPLLAGEVGLALAIDLKGLWQAQIHPMHALNATLTTRLSDPARARALLDRLMSDPALVRQTRHARDGGWVVEIPGWKTVHIAVDAGHLTISTDPELPGRLGQADLAASFVPRLDRRDLVTLLTAPDPTLLWMTDQGVIGAILALQTAEAERFGPADRPDVPHGSATARLEAQLRSVRAEREALERRVVSEDLQELHHLFKRVGTTALHLRRTPGALTLWGGQFVAADTLGELVEDLLEGAAVPPSLDAATRGQLEALEQREDALRRELELLRDREIQSWDAEH